MIAYESLKELAHSLSKVTNKRYVAFEAVADDEITVSLCDAEMIWHKSNQDKGYWDNDCFIDFFTICTREYVDFDWSKCQFDCKEAE